MFKNLKTEVNIKQFAYNLAHSDNIRQGEFLNKLAYELKICCKDKDLSGMQARAISDILDSNGIDLIKSLAEFIKLREDNKPMRK
jgi:hypothetical protein